MNNNMQMHLDCRDDWFHLPSFIGQDHPEEQSLCPGGCRRHVLAQMLRTVVRTQHQGTTSCSTTWLATLPSFHIGEHMKTNTCVETQDGHRVFVLPI